MSKVLDRMSAMLHQKYQKNQTDDYLRKNVDLI
jgi:hypothetical protein